MKASKLFLIPVVMGMISVKAQVINTIVGNGIGGYSGDDSLAVKATLYNPNGIITDKKGNLYITDEGNNVVRKVSPEGIITTIAGNNAGAHCNDGGTATQAQLSIPIDVAVDTAGNIYIAEMGNQIVRKVTTDGKIHTIAGNGTAASSGDHGKATSASLYYPQGLAVYKDKIYISDQSNTIRLVYHDTITTIAGTGIGGYSGDGGPAIYAKLNQPYGLTCDSVGNLYIADSQNNCIRCINAQTGIINTIVGNSAAAYFSGDGNNAFSANLNFPTDVAISHNTLYVADAQNYRIRKICLDTISTICGDGNSGYNGDDGAACTAEIGAINSLAIDTAGNILIADYGNYVIRKISTPSKQTTGKKYLTKSNEFLVYPNPTKDILNISSPADNASNQNVNMTLFDSNGSKVIEFSSDLKKNAIDVSNYSTGVYTLLINSNGREEAFKMIKE